jgi:hypothetical protein
MSATSAPKRRRARRGQPDKLVEPELSRRRREAALHRWQKAGKVYTKDQAMLGVQAIPQVARGGVLLPRQEESRDLQMLRRMLRRYGADRIHAAELMLGALPDAARTVVEIMKDRNQPGLTRLQAARTVFEWGGLKPGEIQKPPEELTGEELTAAIERDQAILQQLAQLPSISEIEWDELAGRR